MYTLCNLHSYTYRTRAAKLKLEDVLLSILLTFKKSGEVCWLVCPQPSLSSMTAFFFSGEGAFLLKWPLFLDWCEELFATCVVSFLSFPFLKPKRPATQTKTKIALKAKERPPHQLSLFVCLLQDASGQLRKGRHLSPKYHT